LVRRLAAQLQARCSVDSFLAFGRRPLDHELVIPTAFRNLSGEKTRWTLIDWGRSSLYEFPTFSKILYGPAI
jgi:hypothetical protein